MIQQGFVFIIQGFPNKYVKNKQQELIVSMETNRTVVGNFYTCKYVYPEEYACQI